jgi:isoleucyl-tRNA synthetase
MTIKKVSSRVSFPELEDKITIFWKENKIFEKSLEIRASSPVYSFVDGPPFVTGTPHYGSLLPSIAKDLIPRFWTMKGYIVRRVFGWDCHGLPIEEKVSQSLNLKSKDDILEYGINNYIGECRKFIKSCTDQWQWYIDKIGRWVDTENAYYTMNPEFNESVLWLFKQSWDKGLIYKGKRVSLYSTDNGTPVSEFEVNMDPSNYRDTQDTSIYVKFKLKNLLLGHENVNIIAWTTTPWTMPAHAAIAINPNIDYSLVEFENQKFVCATKLLCKVFSTDETNIGEDNGKLVKILTKIDGKELIGLSYKPPFDFHQNQINDKNYHIYAGDFVTETDGSGFVHLATYGKEDFELFQKEGIQPLESVDNNGNMTVGSFKGLYLREAKEAIIDELQSMGKLFRSEDFIHRLPYYRGKNPLIYLPQDGYFIDIQKIKPRMLELNESINWYPSHLQQGRFKDVIENSPDWCISRNRFWATIMPIWQAEDGEQIVIGSISELAQYNNQVNKKTNEKNIEEWYFGDQKLYLHRDICDQIVLTKEGKEFKRINEVLDVWMDSGSVPFAEHNYPFGNKDTFEEAFPADYIIEYVGQIRAWFNVLLRVAVIGFDKAPFKNAVVTGNIAGNDGRKMSKSFGNYPDPKTTLENIGGEALRLYLMGSSVMNGEDMNWSDEVLNDQVKNILIPLWNTFSYLTIYSELHNWQPKNLDNISENTMDQWAISITDYRLNNLKESLEKYDIPLALKEVQPLIDDISTWYIRRNRDRFASGDLNALQTLYNVLYKLILALAPIIPFVTEEIYQNMVVEILPDFKQSIHLENYPSFETQDKSFLEQMDKVREISSLGLKLRSVSNFKLRQPLQNLLISDLDIKSWGIEILQKELNVKEIVIFKDTLDLIDYLRTNSIKSTFEENLNNTCKLVLNCDLNDELIKEGLIREIIRHIQAWRKNQGLQMGDLITLFYQTEDIQIQNLIKDNFEQITKETYLSEINYAIADPNQEITIVKINGIEMTIWK